MRTSVKATLDKPEPPPTEHKEVDTVDILTAHVEKLNIKAGKAIADAYTAKVKETLSPAQPPPEVSFTKDWDEDEESEDEPEGVACDGWKCDELIVDDDDKCGHCDNIGNNVHADCCATTHCDKCSHDIGSAGWCEVHEENDEQVCKDCCSSHYYCIHCYKHLGSVHSLDADEVFNCVDCESCSDCECSCEDSEYSPSDGGGGSGKGFGSTTTTPWEMRGIEITASEVYEVSCALPQEEAWPIGSKDIDVVGAFCEFYLLEGIAGFAFNAPAAARDDATCKLIAEEADARLAEVIETVDKPFQLYVDMAVGGELRHHRAAKAMRSHRHHAWVDWKVIRDKIGPQALLDAAEMFEDFAPGGGGTGYGGPKWAEACRILHSRITGKFPPKIFVDRVFNAQHNGGSLLNKVNWGVNKHTNWNIAYIALGLGDCHAADPTMFGPLILGSDPAVYKLLQEWWKATNRVRREQLMQPTPCPTWRHGAYQYGRRFTWPPTGNLYVYASDNTRAGYVNNQLEWLFGDPDFNPATKQRQLMYGGDQYWQPSQKKIGAGNAKYADIEVFESNNLEKTAGNAWLIKLGPLVRASAYWEEVTKLANMLISQYENEFGPKAQEKWEEHREIQLAKDVPLVVEYPKPSYHATIEDQYIKMSLVVDTNWTTQASNLPQAPTTWAEYEKTYPETWAEHEKSFPEPSKPSEWLASADLYQTEFHHAGVTVMVAHTKPLDDMTDDEYMNLKAYAHLKAEKMAIKEAKVAKSLTKLEEMSEKVLSHALTKMKEF